MFSHQSILAPRRFRLLRTLTNHIYAGGRFTASRMSDGTMAANFPSNRSQWKGMTAMSLSTHHIVGLRKDGTVAHLAMYGQASVDLSDWKNIGIPIG